MNSQENEERLKQILAYIGELNDIDDNIFEKTKKSAEFHGHLCPGLAIGIIASKIALRDARRAEDEELVAIVENNACGVDAVQAITGCTFGKGNLIYNNYGKSVFTFYNRKSGSALRLSLKPTVFEREDRDGMRVLFEKVRNDSANEHELTEFWENQIRLAREILENGEEIFYKKEVDMEPPQKAQILESIPCEECGEPTMATCIVKKDGRSVCIPCSRSLE
ncbi:MAG: FmdE family protein [Halobacteriota archaeon]|nr:FmdE family protein [Halobacteriota archaeon]